MNKTQINLAAIVVALSLPLQANSQIETSSHNIQGRQGCINFRAQPSIQATVLKCLQIGSEIQFLRLPPSGRFTWVNDKAGRTWYRAKLSDTGTLGWIMPACTDVFESADTKACTDYGSAKHNSNSQRIVPGTYWVGATGMGLRVAQGRYQYYDEEGNSPWKSISDLKYIREGVIFDGKMYWCLSTLPKPVNSRTAVCSSSGWVQTR